MSEEAQDSPRECHSLWRSAEDGRGGDGRKYQGCERKEMEWPLEKKWRVCVVTVDQNNVLLAVCWDFKRKRREKVKRTRNTQQVIWPKKMSGLVCLVAKRLALWLEKVGRGQWTREWPQAGQPRLASSPDCRHAPAPPGRAGMSPRGSERVSVCISFSEACCSPNSQCNDINHLRFEIQSSFSRSMRRVVLKDISNISRSFDRLSEVIREMSTGRCNVYRGGWPRRIREAGTALGWDFRSARVLTGSPVSVCCVFTRNCSIVSKLAQTLRKVAYYLINHADCVCVCL